jgi:hypothetical protein
MASPQRPVSGVWTPISRMVPRLVTTMSPSFQRITFALLQVTDFNGAASDATTAVRPHSRRQSDADQGHQARLSAFIASPMILTNLRPSRSEAANCATGAASNRIAE